MTTKTTTKKFHWLEVGDVIVDAQRKRHVVTAVGDEWEDTEVYDRRGITVERAKRVFTDTYPEGRVITESEINDASFIVEVR